MNRETKARYKSSRRINLKVDKLKKSSPKIKVYEDNDCVVNIHIKHY